MTRPYTPTWWAAMALCSVAAVVAIVCQPAHADEWTGQDKAQHAKAGALIGGIAAAASQSPTIGCLMASAAGIGKELWDAQHPGHDPSIKDAVVTAVSGCLWLSGCEGHGPCDWSALHRLQEGVLIMCLLPHLEQDAAMDDMCEWGAKHMDELKHQPVEMSLKDKALVIVPTVAAFAGLLAIAKWGPQCH